MEQNNSRLIIVFLCIALSILAGGCFSGYFIVYVWVNTVRLTSAAYANDSYVAMTLFAYFVMCAFIGAALGLMLDSFKNRWITSIGSGAGGGAHRHHRKTDV